MIKRFFNVAALASVALGGIVTVPALAHGHDGRGGYERDDDDDQGDRGEHRRYHNGSRYYDYQAQQYDEYNNGYPRREYRHARRCSSGTTGAILGAALGGLLGREVGRGGYYNRPSTTGLIIGAGGGALAGRAIERNRCR